MVHLPAVKPARFGWSRCGSLTSFGPSAHLQPKVAARPIVHDVFDGRRSKMPARLLRPFGSQIGSGDGDQEGLARVHW